MINKNLYPYWFLVTYNTLNLMYDLDNLDYVLTPHFGRCNMRWSIECHSVNVEPGETVVAVMFLKEQDCFLARILING